jgi:hypothetical protein
MTEYTFHWWSSETKHALSQSVRLEAESHFHGAALALRQFARLGADITVPLAHVEIAEPSGARQTLLVDEVLEWLHGPTQAAFIDREGLAVLLH